MAAIMLMLLVVLCAHDAQGQFVQFVQSSYFPSVPEEEPVNSTIANIVALSLDSFGSPQKGTFSIPDTGDARFFSIEDTGLDASSNSVAILRNTVRLDRDAPNAQTQFTFTATFTSQGISRTALVVVSLEDINDNSPQFVQDVFEVTVFEELRGGTPVLDAVAVDPDQVIQSEELVNMGNDVFNTVVIFTVENGRITYEIIEGNELGHFTINMDNGTLSITPGVQLDVDEQDSYNFTVLATDGGGRNDTARICISVLDSNNNAPQILSPQGVDITLPEDTAPGHVIVEAINATDADSGDNAAIRFLITDGVLRESFDIDETTGRITVSGPLDREVQTVLNLTVMARDSGVPASLQDVIFIVVHLLDINDFTPEFTEGAYTISIIETSVVGSSVAQITAIDLDEGENGTITYSIVQGGDGIFIIDPSTGEILTNASLDRESVSSYKLIVGAVDNPSNVSDQLSAEVNVTILIEDFNDNVPVFSQEAYNVSILDNVTRSEPLIQLTATDIDSGSNAMITYRIEVPDPTYPQAFRIDENTGIIFRNNPLSFENQSNFTYTIKALDNGPFRRSDDVQLNIIVHNVNENPPMFEEAAYNATIAEVTKPGTEVLNVTATDPDMGKGPIGEVYYRIIADFDEAGSFEVNETTGVLTVMLSLDFDVSETIFFEVEAFDGGFPEPYTDRTNITICLTGSDDEPPLINFPEGFFPVVQENTPPEVDVVRLDNFTVDPDLGLGGRDFSFFLFDIYDPYAVNDSFSLNETTGLIRSLREFDRELQPLGVIVAVGTIDLENNSMVTNITIRIRDVNDNPPCFESNVSVTVHEFLPPMTLVLQEYRAIDRDTGTNAELRYGLYDGVGHEMFSIDPITSALRTAAVLNKTIQSVYNLTVIAMDQASTQLFGFGVIYVEVLDSNDMEPIFSESQYTASFSESDPIGTSVFQVNATDSDIGTNAELQYLLAPNSSNSDLFRLDSSTGELFTGDEFDRENVSSLLLTVLAVDSGLVPHPLTGSATILISILDYNEFSPVFNESSYEAIVIENADNGTFVAFVFASDQDADSPNNAIRYSLGGNRSDAFAIDPEIGVITVSGEVDWEEGATFNLTVMATDLADENALQNAVDLTVTVIDVNDRAPVFVPETLDLSIVENTVVVGEGVFVGTVSADDMDSPGNNSDITYTVLMDFTNRKFTLDSETGQVMFVRGTLNRERRDSYDLKIRATDHGDPTPLHTDATLTITVLDDNDFDPVFDPDRYSASVEEAAGIGTPVIALLATDADIESNAALVYSISESVGVFAVNRTTGVIYVSGELDFEEDEVYTFEVLVLDNMGLPGGRNDTAHVVITVTDSNDLRPEFNQSEYSAVIQENLAANTTLLRVSAEDADTNPENSDIEYTLGTSEGSENFGIDPQTGVVYADYLDREEISFYNLTVIANNSLSSYPLSAEVQILITVTDLNDVHPSFSPLVEVEVLENTTGGSVVYILQAIDGDEGKNGTITYALWQPSELFELNATSGELILLRPLDYEAPPRQYMLPVMASDSGNQSLSNYTNVLVSVLDSNDQPPRFAGQDYSVTVDSEAVIGTSILQLVVSDPDEGLADDITLSLLSGNNLGLFVIGNDGTIRTASSLQPHTGASFALVVQASDSELISEVNVTLYLQSGVLTTLPFFTSTTFLATLSETAQNGALVRRFSGETGNADGGYSLSSEIFTVSSAGAVTVANASQLDHESLPLHQVTVSISNSAGDMAYGILDIAITDVNEHRPEFLSDSFFVAIPETVSVGTPFFTAIAFDEDGESPSDIIAYDISLTDTSTRSRFQMNPQTGDLSLTSPLRYESGDRRFNLTLRASNSQASPSLSATLATIEIEVLNGNSFDPEFDIPVHTLRFEEGLSAGVNILNVSARDGDDGSQGQVTYGIFGDHRYLDFRIDTFTGQIFTNQELDYERQNVYTLDVMAWDGGNPGRFSVAAVEVFISDLNDNTPIWDQEVYSASIIENAAIRSRVLQVLATDRDQEVIAGDSAVGFGHITYSITQGDPANNFDVDPDTGLLTVASTLDRETYPEYNLTLDARDDGGLFAIAYLLITIHDSNDRIPSFLETPYVVGLSEDAEIGTLVLTVRANDTDLSRNSEITYHFADTPLDTYDSTGIFSLNATTGDLKLEAAVDREDTPLYTLDLIAVDMGDVQLTGTTQVIVNILDINEFPPEFTRPGFSGDVFENEPPGTSILQVNATDRDFGENSTIMYSLLGEGADVLAIAPDTGIVSVAGPLDFEVVNEYELVVVAIDAGPISERLVNTTNISIAVLDRNDNQPIFSEESYIASISEGAVAGDLVLNVTASDSDSSSNAELVFSLEFLSNGEATANFIIDNRTGIISVSDASALDRERTSSYDIIINVTDLGNPPLQNAVPVTVLVADVNDNSPQFLLPYFQASVSENLPATTSVTHVTATDDDIGTNADLSYSIVSTRSGDGSCLSQDNVDTATCLGVLDADSLMNTVEEAFAVNSQTGEISTLQPLDREAVGVYLLELVAMDAGQPINITNTTFVIVNILDQNDIAPTFAVDVYFTNISEYLGSGQPVLSLMAEDSDLSTNADIGYSLGGSDLFTINSMTGEVFTTSAAGYDREMQDTYNLTVTATDAGLPRRLSGSAIVVVEILDENDSPPVFDNASYTASIGENLPPGTAIVELIATDVDIGSNAKLVYSILTTSPILHFTLDPSSGVLSTTQPLDREVIDTYLVTVLVSDGGNPSLNSSAQVEVIVLDDNDSPPSFQNTSYSGSVEENTSPDQPILRVAAGDADIGTNANIFYSISRVSPDLDAFDIDQTTGDVFTRRPLDAEVSQMYNVTVTADNGQALPFQCSETVVSVDVGDVNDNTPTFQQVDYNVPYLESQPPGSVVVTIIASDLDVTDQNSALSYEITGGSNTSLFNITTVNGVGVVSVAGILDREMEPRHALEITVYDSGVSPLSAMTILTVDLLDANDNTPIFEQSEYAFTLTENLPVSTFIGQVRANDIDQQNVSYSLRESRLLRIDPVSGEIFSSVEFDREEQVIHTVVAVATDDGHSTLRSAEVVVNITILDVNDEIPTFSNTTYYIFLLENTTITTSVLTVNAEDRDFAENGVFAYSIAPGNDSSFFSINGTTGEILLEQEMDRETQDLLAFFIVATDIGEPSLTGSAEVVVMVLDSNDNVPMLNSTEYSAVLDEDTLTGTTVLYIGGSDMDIDENSDLTFSLSEDFSGTFTIGEKNGIISLTRDLDFEFSESYTFQVIIEDGGTPSLSSSSEIFVEVVDLNDNPPLFDSDVYQVSIPENIILGTPIFRIPATDLDSTSNGELRFSILSGNTRSAFSVDEVFGDVLVADYVDREITSSYSLAVRVVDQGIPQFTASTSLEVTIEDVNDHVPMFGSKIYSVLVPESSEVGTRIFTFTALDLDIGTNANLTYEVIVGNENETFQVDTTSGELFLARQLNTEEYPSYALTILVSDNGSPEPLQDTATIRVIVGDTNEYPPRFPQSIYYVNISQDAVLGSPVGHFIATDEDRSSLGTLRYRLLDAPLEFEVAPVEGTVYVVSNLDLGVVVLTLEVTDGLFTTTIDINITVVPATMLLFGSQTYLFSVAETAAFGSVVGEIVPADVEIFTGGQDKLMVDSNGRVVVVGGLDYETNPVYVLNVVVPGNDSNPPIYVVMTIRLLDANDNPPMFESTEYKVNIPESLPPGSTLAILQAFDADEDVSENSEFILSLSSQGNERMLFNLDPFSGVLSLSTTLDYETSISHVLTAVATNDRATPSLSSSTQILISLIDENDNSPQFNNLFYRASIPESTPVGSSIMALEASDADSGTNSELVFSITHLSEPLTFVINQTSGVLATNATFSLDTTTSFIVSVSVADRGNPQPLATPSTVFIEVTPDNTNVPVFSNPNGYSVEILETLNVGGPVVEVTATDDSGTGRITYSIGPEDSTFSIDPLTGVVSLSRALNFNTQGFYQLMIQAEDDGAPPRVSNVELNVTVQEVNNHPPQFQEGEYRVTIIENITIGTPVIQVVATDIDTINITYEITVNYYRQGVPSFRVDSVTGVIVTTAAIDREMADTIELLVSAIDFGYSIRRSTGVPVIITILDLNDTPPMFTQSEFTAGVLRLLIAGNGVIQITATDADKTGDDLVYNIVDGDSNGVFTINSTSGVIETAGRVPEEIEGYQLTITASDGEFVSSVLVNLVPVNDGDFCDGKLEI
jgi:protocadherin Fat 4